jgi:hypothetical protein
MLSQRNLQILGRLTILHPIPNPFELDKLLPPRYCRRIVKKGQIFIRSATAPDTIETVAQTNKA